MRIDLATWAVGLAVHHLDLGPELIMEPPTSAAVALTRLTVEQLAGGTFPSTISDLEMILVGTGRQPGPADEDLTHLTIPALG